MVLLCSLSLFKWQEHIIKVCDPYKSSLPVPLKILLKVLTHLSHLYFETLKAGMLILCHVLLNNLKDTLH